MPPIIHRRGGCELREVTFGLSFRKSPSDKPTFHLFDPQRSALAAFRGVTDGSPETESLYQLANGEWLHVTVDEYDLRLAGIFLRDAVQHAASH